MLDSETKRRIDTARDILVGKVPDPKSQVEQITIALIYKFMDDMDAESEELGGERKFFAGEFAKYGWAKIMRSELGGHKMLDLYAEAITRMPENPGIPPLFRDIFKNAYLPYRDPETLRSFLKIINDFSYDHSERLGDAFEYLLSVLGSQGDAGQFRTPRHIIDFIVSIVDPKKNEIVLDPACGTAGFLISSYKHILAANRDADGNSTLTPDDRGRLAGNFKGYDISPDMVRLSLVNMYLHGFTDPHMHEYDTLTSQDRWNEYADVILANPPFMSPKGGIKPHNRFSVQSKRSEVLFVDYMAEHLTPNGRAGIIVPEGVIFQGQNAYARLRGMLVEDYLVAVVSLPVGVFNPYSGVKTSVLILDKALAKQTERVAFFRVENDGFGLGTQRRPIDKNDLPKALGEIAEYMRRLRARESVDDLMLTLGLVVPREKIAASGDFNLSGERYRENHVSVAAYPLHRLHELLEIQSGYPFKSEQFDPEHGFPIVRIRDIKPNRTQTRYVGEYDPAFVVRSGDLLVGMDGEFNCVIWRGGDALLNQRVCRLHSFKNCLKEYVARVIPLKLKEIEDGTYAVTVKHISAKQIAAIELPLPPLEVQKKIVAEIEGYQKVIDGARDVVDNYRARIHIDPAWPWLPMRDLGDGSRNSLKAGPFGSSLRKDCYVSSGYKVYGQEQVIRGDATYGDYYVDENKYRELEACRVQAGDVLISLVGTYGKTLIVPREHEPGIINPRLLKITLDQTKMLPDFFVAAFAQESVMSQVHGMSHGGTMAILNLTVLRDLRVPAPPLDEQRRISADLAAERHLVCGTRELAQRLESRIVGIVARLWDGAEGAGT